VGSRRFHAERLRQLTGLEVGEGQATILLNDLAAWAGFEGEEAHHVSERALATPDAPLHRAAHRWLVEVFAPTIERLRQRLGDDIDPVQSYCDFLEVKWLLSEEAGQDVGVDAAIERLAANLVPVGSSAGMAVAEEPLSRAGVTAAG
jgi:hypothetical protein